VIVGEQTVEDLSVVGLAFRNGRRKRGGEAGGVGCRAGAGWWVGIGGGRRAGGIGLREGCRSVAAATRDVIARGEDVADLRQASGRAGRAIVKDRGVGLRGVGEIVGGPRIRVAAGKRYQPRGAAGAEEVGDVEFALAGRRPKRSLSAEALPLVKAPAMSALALGSLRSLRISLRMPASRTS
jgi:hypothetical protein